MKWRNIEGQQNAQSEEVLLSYIHCMYYISTYIVENAAETNLHTNSE